MPPLVTSVSSQPLFMLADGNILLKYTPCSDFFAGPSWNVASNLKSTSLPPISPPISRNLASRSTSLLLRPSSSSDDLFENHRRMRPRRATDLQGCAPLILLLPVTGIKPGAVPAGRAQQKRAASSHNRSNLSNHRVAETGYGGYLRLPSSYISVGSSLVIGPLSPLGAPVLQLVFPFGARSRAEARSL